MVDYLFHILWLDSGRVLLHDVKRVVRERGQPGVIQDLAHRIDLHLEPSGDAGVNGAARFEYLHARLDVRA